MTETAQPGPTLDSLLSILLCPPNLSCLFLGKTLDMDGGGLVNTNHSTSKFFSHQDSQHKYYISMICISTSYIYVKEKQKKNWIEDKMRTENRKTN